MTDDELYERAEPARLLSDEELAEFREATAEEVAALDDETKAKLYATSKWHFLRRMDATFAPGGMSVGDMSFDDVVKEVEGRAVKSPQAE